MRKQNIEIERVKNGITKRELAKKLGISFKTYYNWINGDVDIPSMKLYELSVFFGVSMDYLFGVEKIDRKEAENESKKDV